MEKLENTLSNWGLYHTKVQAWRFWYYLREHGILGYTGALVDQPDSYFYDIATISLVSQWVKQTKGRPRLKPVSLIDKIKAGIKNPFKAEFE